MGFWRWFLKETCRLNKSDKALLLTIITSFVLGILVAIYIHIITMAIVVTVIWWLGVNYSVYLTGKD